MATEGTETRWSSVALGGHRWFARTAVALVLAVATAGAQVRAADDHTVSEHVGPLRPVSRPVSAGSRPVRDGLGTIGEASRSVHGGGPVRDATTRSMRSGPVSSLSRGPMTQPRTRPHGGSVSAASAGAVKHDADQPLGSRISQPLRELGPLQQHLRQLRALGDAEAVAAAAAPLGAAPVLPAAVEPALPELAEHAPIADGHDAAVESPASFAEAPHVDAPDPPSAPAAAHPLNATDAEPR